MHIQKKKTIDIKETFYDNLNGEYEKIPTYNLKILLKDSNSK